MKRTLLLLLLCACGDEIDCAKLDEASCAQHEQCRVFTYGKVNKWRECLELRTVSCASADDVCDDAGTLTVNDGRELHLRSSGCIGEGESRFTPEPDSPQASLTNLVECLPEHPCDSVEVDACKRDDRCEVIEGRMLDTANQCVQRLEPKGCQQRGRVCAPELVYASSFGRGLTYQFPSDCRPRNYERTKPPQGTLATCEGSE